MTIKPGSVLSVNIFVKIIASLLVMLGVFLLLTGQGFPEIPGSAETPGSPVTPGLVNTLLAKTAYATAASFILCGLALWAVVLHRLRWISISATLLFIINILAVGTHQTALVSTLGFILISVSLLPACLLHNHPQSYSHIIVTFLNFLVALIAVIAFIDLGLGAIGRSAFPGLDISIDVAIGLLLMSLSLLILFYTSAVAAFNRLGFFHRLAIAFGFMTVLFLGSGSTALIQIGNISTIINDLYRNPLQVDQAALNIAEEVGVLNRKLKDIAVNPELWEPAALPEYTSGSQLRITQNIKLIAARNEMAASDLQQLEAGVAHWYQLIDEALQQLRENDIDAYRALLLNRGQEQTIELELITGKISNQAKQHVRELGDAVIQNENNAKKILIVSSLGFLITGLIIALLITRSLIRQLYLLRRAMIDIANKKTDITIPGRDDANEMGEMARTLAVFAETINRQRRMESRMRQIIEAAPNGIIMINDQGLIEVVNKQAEDIFNYQRSQLLGKKIEVLVPKSVKAEHPGLRNLFFADPSPRIMGAGRELCGLRSDGSEVPVEIGLAPIETEEGLKVLATIVDISERKKSAQRLVEHQHALEKANKNLEKSNKELETFAYVASHDLKSPLRGIVQLSNWIEDDLSTEDYAELPNHMRLMKSRIARMEKLLDDLLLFNRAGKSNGKLTLVNVREMAAELFSIQNIHQGIRLESSGELPTFTTFSTPFEQVLRNLFSNALKHHDRENGVVTITCNDADNEFYEFSVSDDGPGIPEQYQQRVFAMFQTLKTRDEVEGSGMGLALIKKIVEAYGGTITLMSEGRGTCFTFSWPKHIAEAHSNG